MEEDISPLIKVPQVAGVALHVYTLKTGSPMSHPSESALLCYPGEVQELSAVPGKGQGKLSWSYDPIRACSPDQHRW